jgi:hypothetical protein
VWAKWALSGVSGARVPFYPARAPLLRRAAELATVDGFWLEFGVFHGDSINQLAHLTTRGVFGFDSFEGLPSDWGSVHRKGTFSLGGTMPEVEHNVVLVRGWFSDTLPEFVASRGEFRVALLHIDCDLYESARVVLSVLQDRIVAGTVIVFDEYSTLRPDDEARAFREFVRSGRRRYRILGCSPEGQVAVQILK